MQIPISLRFFLILTSYLPSEFPKGLFSEVTVKIFKALLHFSILAIWPVHLNLLDLITLTVQTMKVLTVEHSPLPICIPLGPTYPSQYPKFSLIINNNEPEINNQELNQIPLHQQATKLPLPSGRTHSRFVLWKYSKCVIVRRSVIAFSVSWRS